MITVTSLTHPSMYKKMLDAMTKSIKYGQSFVVNNKGKPIIRIYHSKQVGFMFDCGIHGDITKTAMKALRKCRGRQKRMKVENETLL